MKNGPIDFVLPWVDGNDKEWIKKKNQFREINTTGSDENRYRDWGLLKYWFRSSEINAPWVNKIFLITDNQIPSFLNTDNPKLKLVFHKDYIPSQYLHTFNSSSIEMNVHRITDYFT